MLNTAVEIHVINCLFTIPTFWREVASFLFGRLLTCVVLLTVSLLVRNFVPFLLFLDFQLSLLHLLQQMRYLPILGLSKEVLSYEYDFNYSV